MQLYPKLFSPIKLGSLELKNRIFLGPMGTALGDDLQFRPTERMIRYYEERAKGGTGLIIIEQCVVQQRGIWSRKGGGLWSDDFIPAWTELVDRIHKAGGKVVIQVGHLGRSTLDVFNGGYKPFAPSPVPDHYLDNQVDEMTLEDIWQFKQDYFEAAKRVKKAGFDGIQIHCTHGYMLASFLSGRSNKRMDEYGGTLEGRLRLPLEIIKGLRRILGRDYPIMARLATVEPNGGRTLEESRVIARALTEAGLDALDLSAGSYSEIDWEIPPSYFGYAMNMENIEKIKAAVDVPVLASGRITEPRLAEQLIAEGRCDMVGINRAGIADPEFANKAGGGDTDCIRRCIGCVRCIDSVFTGEIRCTVNPHAGQEDAFPVLPATKKKKVLIVGGGPAGLESAKVCALRGHEVTVAEKRNKLGGQIISAAVPPYKYETGSLITTQTNELKRLGVKILINQNVDVEVVKDFGADEVVVATGAVPIIPDIPGINGENVVTAVDVLEGKAHALNNVVIIGGNMIGCETAEFLIEYGKKVTVLEKTGEMGIDLAVVPRPFIIKKMKERGIDIQTNATVTSIEGGSVVVEKNGETLRLENVETIIVAAGMTSENELAKALEKEGISCRVVGDASNVSRIMQSLVSAYTELHEI